MLKIGFIIALTFILSACASNQKINLKRLESPIIFKGDSVTAYRDPAILFEKDTFYLFFTMTEIEPDGLIYMYIASSKSSDLVNWTTPKKLTPKDQKCNFSSPGNIIRVQNEWILCIQTYPRPDYTVEQMPRYGTKDARLYIMRSKDIENWNSPELLKVKGNSITESEMGRMIDPYLLADKNEPGKYWCFYKQNGVSMSFTYDFKNWTYFGNTISGENVCVLTEDNTYVLFHSPENGIGIKKSIDMVNWKEWGSLITLGQLNWNWAKGRLTAGAVISLKDLQDVNKYLMFFHGSGPKKETEGDFDKNSSIGLAWSDDLLNWDWPNKKTFNF